MVCIWVKVCDNVHKDDNTHAIITQMSAFLPFSMSGDLYMHASWKYVNRIRDLDV